MYLSIETEGIFEGRSLTELQRIRITFCVLTKDKKRARKVGGEGANFATVFSNWRGTDGTPRSRSLASCARELGTNRPPRLSDESTPIFAGAHATEKLNDYN